MRRPGIPFQRNPGEEVRPTILVTQVADFWNRVGGRVERHDLFRFANGRGDEWLVYATDQGTANRIIEDFFGLLPGELEFNSKQIHWRTDRD